MFVFSFFHETIIMDTRKREKLSPSHNVCVFIIVNRIKATAKNERNNDNNGVLLFFLKKKWWWYVFFIDQRKKHPDIMTDKRQLLMEERKKIKCEIFIQNDNGEKNLTTLEIDWFICEYQSDEFETFYCFQIFNVWWFTFIYDLL